MQLINDDCFIAMGKLPDKSIDFILTDPPYGTTQCKWDNIIPFEPMWNEIQRVIKDNGLNMIGFGKNHIQLVF